MSDLGNLTSRWARLGVCFNVEFAAHPVDVERLLADTARHAHEHSRLLIGAVSWLATFGSYVDIDRLLDLIRRELSRDDQSVLGLMLELARNANPLELAHFEDAIAVLAPRHSGRPLSDIENESPVLRKLACDRASATSRKWGQWYETFPVKLDSLRPLQWVVAHNTNLVRRTGLGRSA